MEQRHRRWAPYDWNWREKTTQALSIALVALLARNVARRRTPERRAFRR